MAFESPLLHVGSLVLSTLMDARRSSITGTTLVGPNGSGQFYPLFISATANLTVTISTSTSAPVAPSTTAPFIGILQNTPGPGQAADYGFVGITKAIAGSSFAAGILLQTSSTAGGYIVPYLQGNGAPIGYALEAPVLNQVFSMMLFPFGGRSS